MFDSVTVSDKGMSMSFRYIFANLSKIDNKSTICLLLQLKADTLYLRAKLNLKLCQGKFWFQCQLAFKWSCGCQGGKAIKECLKWASHTPAGHNSTQWRKAGHNSCNESNFLLGQIFVRTAAFIPDTIGTASIPGSTNLIWQLAQPAEKGVKNGWPGENKGERVRTGAVKRVVNVSLYSGYLMKSRLLSPPKCTWPAPQSPEEGQKTRLPESTCDIVENISLKCEGREWLELLWQMYLSTL